MAEDNRIDKLEQQLNRIEGLLNKNIDNSNSTPTARVQQPTPPKKEIKQVLNNVKKEVKKERSYRLSNNFGTEMITPIMLIGVMIGIIVGIPFINLLFFILLPLAGILAIKYLQIESDHRIIVGFKKAIVTTLVLGFVAAIISSIVQLSLQVFLAGPTSDFFSSMLSGMDQSTFNILMTFFGFDRAFELIPMLARVLLKLIIFPIFAMVGGLIGSKFLR